MRGVKLYLAARHLRSPCFPWWSHHCADPVKSLAITLDYQTPSNQEPDLTAPHGSFQEIALTRAGYDSIVHVITLILLRYTPDFRPLAWSSRHRKLVPVHRSNTVAKLSPVTVYYTIQCSVGTAPGYYAVAFCRNARSPNLAKGVLVIGRVGENFLYSGCWTRSKQKAA